MRRSPRIVTAATITILLSLVACGGGPKRLTKEEFITAWDAICKRDDAQINQLAQDLPDQPTADNLSQFEDYFKQAIPMFKDEIRDLGEPKPPEADQATIDGILSDLNAVVGTLQEAQQAAAAGDLDAFNAAGDKVNPQLDAANTAAQNYGFQECGAT